MLRIPALTAIVLLSVLPMTEAAQTASKQKSLYDRLGGKTAITAVVDEFVGRVAADNRINHFFAATASNPARLAALPDPTERDEMGHFLSNAALLGGTLMMFALPRPWSYSLELRNRVKV